MIKGMHGIQKINQNITIFNPLGQQIKKINVNSKSGEIIISEFNKGMYFLNVKLENGTTVSTKIFKK